MPYYVFAAMILVGTTIVLQQVVSDYLRVRKEDAEITQAAIKNTEKIERRKMKDRQDEFLQNFCSELTVGVLAAVLHLGETKQQQK